VLDAEGLGLVLAEAARAEHVGQPRAAPLGRRHGAAAPGDSDGLVDAIKKRPAVAAALERARHLVLGEAALQLGEGEDEGALEAAPAHGQRVRLALDARHRVVAAHEPERVGRQP
jgi:hypothetical protein